MPYYFWFNMRRFASDSPTATIAELKAMANATPGYHTYKEVDGGKDLPFGEGEAVDLTPIKNAEPRFYTVPPATMYRGADS